MSVVIITGDGGFLGQCLATSILEKGTISSQPVAKVVLADNCFPTTLQPKIEASSSMVIKLEGDVSSSDFCEQIYAEAEGSSAVSVFHLNAVMSGDGERDFDLCMNVNLHGFINMMEKAHKLQTTPPPKFIFCSAGTTIGSGAPTDYITQNDTISDATRATPHTTYSATKACCELLLSDYARRGFVDARGLRLPTIVVRAGAPNAATTSCFLSVVREPLAGVPVPNLPLARHVRHAVTGKQAAVAAMLLLHDTELSRMEEVLGFDWTVFLPAVALLLGDLEKALLGVVHTKSGKLAGASHIVQT